MILRIFFYQICLLLSFEAVIAQTPQLVKDINPTGSSVTFGLGLIEYKNRIYFSADNDTIGNELWVSDGTESGTNLFYDFESGPNPSSITRSFIWRDSLYFAVLGNNSSGLWVTDGTPTGTHLVDTVKISAIGGVILYHDKFYFTTDDGIHGEEPWVSDGTSAGTHMLSDIRPGYLSGGVHSFAVYNDKLYFTGYDSDSIGSNDIEIWVSDGSEQGTHLLKNINTTPSNSTVNGLPELFGEFNGKLYFTMDDGIHGMELWQTDGTDTGTVMLLDINIGSADASPILDIHSKATGNTTPNSFVIYNGELYFLAVTATNGRELWVTDGTPQGTHLFYDLNTGTQNGQCTDFTLYNNKLYFSAVKSSYGRELWVTDGTPSGTRMIKDLYPGAQGASPFRPLIYNGLLYFVAEESFRKAQLYSYNSFTDSITMIVPVTYDDNACGTSGGNHSPLALVLGNIYYAASYVPNHDNFELYKYASTPAVISGWHNGPVYKVYPNPAQDNLFVSDIEGTGFQTAIYSVTGNLLSINHHENNSGIINVETLNKGLYILQVRFSDGKTENVKWVKQ